jgi:hypothetical protein
MKATCEGASGRDRSGGRDRSPDWKHFPKLILEVDNTTVAKALQAKTIDRSRYEDAKLLLSKLDASSIQFSGRETNRVADSLIKLACSLGEREMKDLPVSVRDLVSDDSTEGNHI